MSQGIDLVHDLYRALAARDHDAFHRLCAPDIEWIQTEGLPSGGRYYSAAAVIEQVFERFRGEWDDWRFEVEECFEAGACFGARDRVVVLGRYSGRYRRSGRSLSAATAHVFDLEREGAGELKIRRFRQFADTKLFADARR